MQNTPLTTAHQPGFTLIELLVTVAVTGVLLTLAVPSFREMSIKNQLSGYSNDLLGTLNFARSEAVRRGIPITVCTSNDQKTCSGTWSDGWLVFENKDDDNPVAVDGDESILKMQGPMPANYTLNADATVAGNVTYRGNGSTKNTGMFVLCHADKTVGSRAISLTALRPRLAKDSNGNGIPNQDGGDDITSCEKPSGT
jgi:type IV fimbrial biogenesis protein FimT